MTVTLENEILAVDTLELPESHDAKVLRDRIMRAIEKHFSPTDRGDRNVVRRAILRVFADRPLQTLSLKDVMNASGVQRYTAAKAINRLVKLTNEWAYEYGFRIILEYVPSGYRLPAISVRAELSDKFRPTNCRRVSTHDRCSPTIPFWLTDKIRNHIRFILDGRGIPGMPICDLPPVEASRLVDNSTWVLQPESGEVSMMREILANARRGKATSTFHLKSRRGTPSEGRGVTNRMEAKTISHALELGFFVEAVRWRIGYIFPFFLDPKVRRELLLGRNLVSDTSKLTFFDQVKPFSLREFKRRLSEPKTQEMLKADSHLPTELYQRVAHDQSQGIYRTWPEWASIMGLYAPTFWQLIRDAQNVRHERSFYLRYRSDTKVELVLLKNETTD